MESVALEVGEQGVGYETSAEQLNEWNAYGAPGFVPTPRQMRVVEAVSAGLAKGIFYTRDMLAFCIDRLGVTPEQAARGCGRVEGGHMGMEVYYARGYVEAVKARETERELFQKLRPHAGMKLGALVFNDFKVCKSMTVAQVEDDSGRISLVGSRGNLKVSCWTTAERIRCAMDRAAERGNRKDTFEAFTKSMGDAKCEGVRAGPAPAPAADGQEALF